MVSVLRFAYVHAHLFPNGWRHEHQTTYNSRDVRRTRLLKCCVNKHSGYGSAVELGLSP
jgi:hypothetical protein